VQRTTARGRDGASYDLLDGLRGGLAPREVDHPAFTYA
jgi:hypothetical protein